MPARPAPPVNSFVWRPSDRLMGQFEHLDEVLAFVVQLQAITPCQAEGPNTSILAHGHQAYGSGSGWPAAYSRHLRERQPRSAGGRKRAPGKSPERVASRWRCATLG